MSAQQSFQEPWMLPDAVDELLPRRAATVEALRRKLLDLYASWGYLLCTPPLVERLDALLTGAGAELNSQTVKLVDPLDGALLGIRADMTPQAARIDAHRLRGSGPRRLCYIGDVLRARPEAPGQSRNPIQVGLELFGHDGPASDREVLALMIESLLAAGLETIHLDLGHVAIYRSLARQAGLADDARRNIQQLLQGKCEADVRTGLAAVGAESEAIATLSSLHGSAAVIETARGQLGSDNETVAALDELEAVAAWIAQRYPQVDVCVDLAELPGYAYHTGLVFSAFVPGHGRVLARGGRYDRAGEVFGRSRPATGFSTNLRSLAKLSPIESPALTGIFAPAGEDEALLDEISRLRAAGERVVQSLPDCEQKPADVGCDRQLVSEGGQWQVVAI